MAERYVAKKFENGKYGFVDENGKVVIEPKFDEAKIADLSMKQEK